MVELPGSLPALLERESGSKTRARSVLMNVCYQLGLSQESLLSPVVLGLGLLQLGVEAERVARLLTWMDFEQFCAALLRARGFDVRENVRLSKPRVQIDIIARSPSMALIVDCKHWAKERGWSAMSRAAEAQAKRAKLARKQMKDLEPLAVVLLVLSNEQTRFAGGAAIVPIHTFGDFLSNLPMYLENLSLF